MTAKKKKILIIFGGTGLIGSEVIRYFLSEKSFFRKIILVSRQNSEKLKKNALLNHPDLEVMNWDEEILLKKFSEHDVAIVNLVGENIATKNWSSSRKLVLKRSRVESTERILRVLKQLKKLKQLEKNNTEIKKLPIWLNTSAIGYYDDEINLLQNESNANLSTSSSNYLNELCREWETAAKKAEEEKLVSRLIIMRIGVVLSQVGGALPPMLKSIRFGLGTYLGRGTQGFSWIYVREIPRIIEFILTNPNVTGVVNLVSPHPLSFDQFLKNLAGRLKRPILIRIPEWLLRLGMGERARLITQGPWLEPQVLLKSGYRFYYKNLTEVWDDLNL